MTKKDLKQLIIECINENDIQSGDLDNIPVEELYNMLDDHASSLADMEKSDGEIKSLFNDLMMIRAKIKSNMH